MIKELLADNTDEVIALSVTGAFLISWLIGVNMPNEPFMIVLGYYFGKKKA